MIMYKLLSYFPGKFQFRFWGFIYGLRYGVVSNCINACWAIRLAWKFLCGKILIVDYSDTESNGGYKYRSVTFSKRPFSTLHTYEDF